jgi:uncharacterized cysteine cluster protein YcgN (CxxCxxCC family)
MWASFVPAYICNLCLETIHDMTMKKRRPESEGVATNGTGPTADVPFWKRKTLDTMTPAEWESVCDGCARCCLVKLEDEDTGDVHFTDLTCRLLDAGACRCSNYPGRQAEVDDCVKLTPDVVRELSWLPPTCGYRLLADGKELQWWHPLVSGSPDTVHEAGVSVRGRTFASEDDLPIDDYPARIKAWPWRVPKAAKARR